MKISSIFNVDFFKLLTTSDVYIRNNYGMLHNVFKLTNEKNINKGINYNNKKFFHNSQRQKKLSLRVLSISSDFLADIFAYSQVRLSVKG